MARSQRVTAVRAMAGLVVAGVMGLAGCGSGSAPQPSAAPPGSAAHLPRIATDSDIAMDALIAVGLTPACASADNGSDFLPLFNPYLAGVTNLGPSVQGSDFNVEALASCAPDLIVAPSYDEASAANTYYNTAEKAEKGVARTVFFNQPNPPVDAAGQATSTWKNWLHGVADPVGRREQANQVIAKLDQRAAAIRGQVAGEPIATVSLESASSWQLVNQYLPLATIYVQDLGLKNVTLKPSYWGQGCLDDTKPVPCYSNDLSMEKLPALDSAAAILVQSLTVSSSDTATFNTSPLWRKLAPVQAGHVASAQFYTETGPIGVGFIYSAVAKAFGLKEFSARLAGGTGGTASLTLDPGPDRLCWAVSPALGQDPAEGPVTLAAGSSSVTLAKAPAYTSPETMYPTSPPGAQASGCGAVSAALAQTLATSPAGATLHIGTAEGTLQAGAARLPVS